jgi:hypothetical protein
MNAGLHTARFPRATSGRPDHQPPPRGQSRQNALVTDPDLPDSPATPEQEALRTAAQLRSGYGGIWDDAGSDTSPWGLARVCRVRPAHIVHVVGASTMAERLRELFASGYVPGWSLQPMPATRTPLHHYFDELVSRGPQPGSRRGFNQLDRHGFVYAEEVAACPDEAMLAIPNIGSAGLARIRAILGGPPPTTHSGSPATAMNDAATPAQPPPDQHGWRLEVSADGTSAVVHAPGTPVITELRGTTTHLLVTRPAPPP